MLKIMVCLMMLVAMASVASAKEGFYIGAQIPYNTIGGDFDGKTISKYDPAAGLGLLAGYTFPINLAVEVDIARSAHSWKYDTSLATYSGTDVFTEVSLNGKYSFVVSNEFQPYLFAGIGSFAISGKDLATDKTETLSGTGVNAGVGADYYFTPNVSAGLGVIQKFITYDKYSGGTLIKNIKGDTTTVRFDVGYHF